MEAVNLSKKQEKKSACMGGGTEDWAGISEAMDDWGDLGGMEDSGAPPPPPETQSLQSSVTKAPSDLTADLRAQLQMSVRRSSSERAPVCAVTGGPPPLRGRAPPPSRDRGPAPAERGGAPSPPPSGEMVISHSKPDYRTGKMEPSKPPVFMEKFSCLVQPPALLASMSSACSPPMAHQRQLSPTLLESEKSSPFECREASVPTSEPYLAKRIPAATSGRQRQSARRSLGRVETLTETYDQSPRVFKAVMKSKKTHGNVQPDGEKDRGREDREDEYNSMFYMVKVYIYIFSCFPIEDHNSIGA